MFMPFDTISNVYWVAVPKYEWVPVAPPALPTHLAQSAGESSSLEVHADAMPPPLQLVFRGFEWRTYSASYLRENPAWHLCAENRRDLDEERARESRPTQNVKPPSAIGDGPSSDTPQSPPGDLAAKLSGERTDP